ncbi:serine hydrolase domain-containing protein [Amycolatopsis umgeniensis]|uniref:D-alanyl-D-alanine carboxypeptidase n=1 Tax=Amycolatopsis umgeniensis TaxID=336628 RepID=A0A841AYT1_9PSEU|nr:serine hydrolase domain-containing protein [Amycolatopsis umgeniensis]MBB5851258.1 D-alanyl-D-alanine carboxypeptidase [Amycolatopsis umgeniensis]
MRKTLLRPWTKIRLVAVLTAAGLIATTGTALADTGADRKVVQEALDQIIASGGSLGVQARVTDGHQRFTARSGKAELGSNRPVPENGRFRVGSITKTFVSTVLLQLSGEGKVVLDTPVVRYLPGLIDNRITVRQILQHTSGLYDYTNALPLDPDQFEQIRYKHWTPQELLKISTDKPLDFDPGTRWSYSNTNYVVAGLLVEKLTGRPYEKAVEHRILKPLRLDDTEIPGDNVDIRGPHAHGYVTVAGKPNDITRINPSVAWAAGEMISTTRDLDTFGVALASGKLLKPAQQQEISRTTAVSPDYGLGLQVQTLPCGSKVWGHGGGIPGYSSQLLTTPDTKKRLELSVTSAPTEGDPNEGFRKLLTEVFC